MKRTLARMPESKNPRTHELHCTHTDRKPGVPIQLHVLLLEKRYMAQRYVFYICWKASHYVRSVIHIGDAKSIIFKRGSVSITQNSHEIVHGEVPVSQHSEPDAMISVAQQSSGVNVEPPRLHPTSTQIPHASAQHTPKVGDSTPTTPLLHVLEDCAPAWHHKNTHT